MEDVDDDDVDERWVLRDRLKIKWQVNVNI